MSPTPARAPRSWALLPRRASAAVLVLLVALPVLPATEPAQASPAGGVGPLPAVREPGAPSSASAAPMPAGQAASLSAALGLRAEPGGAPPGETARAGTRSRDRARTAAWGWPLTGHPEIVNPYDPPPQPWLPGHRGIDLAGVAGEPVLAVDAGVVSYSGEIAGVGIVSVSHASGLRSTYQPVTDRVPRGTRVARGERIGVLDVGGHCGLTECLHLGARRGDDYVDPTPLLLPVELSLVPPQGDG